MWETRRRTSVNNLTALDEPSTTNKARDYEKEEERGQEEKAKNNMSKRGQQALGGIKRQRQGTLLLRNSSQQVPVTPELAEKGTSHERTQEEQVSPPRFLVFEPVAAEAEAGGLPPKEFGVAEDVPFGLRTPTREEQEEEEDDGNRTRTRTRVDTVVYSKSRERGPPNIKRKYKLFKKAHEHKPQSQPKEPFKSCRRSLLSQFQEWPKPVPEVELQNEAIEAFFTEISEYHSAKRKARRIL